MNNKFIEVAPETITDNFIKTIGHDSFLLTAGSIDKFNTMTVGWAGMGFLWKKPVVFVFVRPQRFTYKFMEESEFFTISFFDEKYKKALSYCGTHSGKDVDKCAETGLIPLEINSQSIAFEQARLIFDCKKMYYDDIKPQNFIDKSIDNLYSQNDYHRMYVGEIVKCFVEK